MTTLLISVLVFGVVIIYSPDLYDAFNLPKITFFYIVVIILAINYLIKQISKRKIEIKRSVINLPLLFFLLAMVLATLFSVEPPQSLWGRYMFYSFGLIPFIAGLLICFIVLNSDKLNERIIINSIIASASGVSFIAILQYFQLIPKITLNSGPGWIDSTFGSPVYFAGFLTLAFPLSFAKLTDVVEKRTGLLNFVILLSATLIILLAVFFSSVRAALIGIIASAGVFLVSRRPKYSYKHPLLIIISFFILFLIIHKPYQARFISIIQPDEISNKVRIEGWKSGLKAFLSKSLLGYGPDNFTIGFRKNKTLGYVRSAGPRLKQQHAHNEIIQMGVTAGLLGLGSYLLFWGVIFKHGFNTFKKSVLQAGVFSSLVAVFIYNQFNSSMVAGFVVFWIFVGVFFRFGDNPVIFFQNTRCLKLIQKTLVLLALTFLYFSTKPYIADKNFAQGKGAESQGDLNTAFYKYDNAIKLNPRPFKYYLTVLDNRLLLANAEKDVLLKKKYLQEGLDFALKGLEKNSQDADAYYNLGVIYATIYQSGADDYREKSAKAFLMAVQLDNHFVDGLSALARVSFLLGRKEQGLNLLKEVLYLDSENQEAKKYLNNIQEGKNKRRK